MQNCPFSLEMWITLPTSCLNHVHDLRSNCKRPITRWTFARSSFLNGPPPRPLFIYFRCFQAQNLQKKLWNSNSDCHSTRQKCWPLDHHHSPIFKELFRYKKTNYRLSPWVKYFWPPAYQSWCSSLIIIDACQEVERYKIYLLEGERYSTNECLLIQAFRSLTKFVSSTFIGRLE